jgi:hypothetical protein
MTRGNDPCIFGSFDKMTFALCCPALYDDPPGRHRSMPEKDLKKFDFPKRRKQMALQRCCRDRVVANPTP